MGAYLNLLVGPYARCRFDVKETVETRMNTRRVCVNPKCTQFQRNKIEDPFCPKCGNPVGKIQASMEVKKKTPTVTRDQYEAIFEEDGIIGQPFFEVNRFFNNNRQFPDWDVKEMWFVGNQDKRRNPPRIFWHNTDSIRELDLDFPDTEAEIAWFETAYKRELDLLRPIYEEVKVEWRIFSVYI